MVQASDFGIKRGFVNNSERTGNIYENKGSGQKVDQPRSWRAGAEVAFDRLRCAEGASCPACFGLSLRDIADPTHRGLRQTKWYG